MSVAPPLLTAVAPAASREFFLWQFYQKDTSMCPKNLTSILVTISISASWFFGQFNCRRVGLSASLLSASWFVGELSSYRLFSGIRFVVFVYRLVNKVDQNNKLN